MLNIGRNDRWVDLKDSSKTPAKPGTATTTAAATTQPPLPGVSPARTTAPAAAEPPIVHRDAPQREPLSREPSPREPSAREPHREVPNREATHAPSPEEAAGSKLFVGVNIKLKGVEISNCDVLVIEGQVDATINSKVMEISKPGTLTGTAMIDVAEIHGEFSGELTARTKLVVHGTGRVTGTVRYGKLVVAEGGTLDGELKQIDAAAPSRPEKGSASESRSSSAQSAH
ncbi:MAG TPA: polymer-forming cytoskeletal protein [Casimicrobiaceae bacterium]|nr:polymer-forming cytoskeletal protein [Casimicrobiaceae bacterium]